MEKVSKTIGRLLIYIYYPSTNGCYFTIWGVVLNHYEVD